MAYYKKYIGLNDAIVINKFEDTNITGTITATNCDETQ
jgi:hypothetical protein